MSARFLLREGGLVNMLGGLSVLSLVGTQTSGSATSALGFPLLTGLVVIPAIGALLVAMTSAKRGDFARLIGLLTSVSVGALSIYLLTQFVTSDAGFQFTTQQVWVEQFGISWHLGVDGISLFMVVLTGLLFPLVLVGVTPHHDPKPYTAWMLLLEAGCMGVFLSLDLFLFFVAFEIVLVPMYFLISGWGSSEREYAALKFFLFTMAGSALMLVGILTLAFLHQQATGVLTFDLVEIAEAQSVAESTGRWLFLAFALAFAVKVPIFPLHTWLPDAHTQAPTGASVILAGVMLKLGTYGLLRFGLYLFPEAASYFAPLLVTLGVIGIIYGAIVAAMQRDLKRLVAYSSVAHLGFIVLGTFAFTSQGLEGGILQMVNHGISTGALFLLVGMIYERRHTREISELHGLQKAAPILAVVFTVVMFSSIGLPGLNGFVGEFLILIGSFVTRRWWAVVAASGVILAALYLLWAYQRVFHGEPEGENATMPDLTWREGFVLAPLLVAIVGLGVYPKPMLDRIEPAVERLIDHVDDNSDFNRAPAGSVKPVKVDQHGGGARHENLGGLGR
ncbi:MAG: NADH-quinone oxidoreductase subunit M [Acidimicrobiales bacterium]